MDNKSDEHFIIVQAKIEAKKLEMRANNQDSEKKMTPFTVKFETILAVISIKLNTLVSSPTHKGTFNPLDPTIVIPDNRRAPPLEGVNSIKICDMWNLKHEIRSPKLYEPIIKI